MSNQDQGSWVCPDCGQETLAESRYCEVCGKERGSDRPGPGPALVARLGMGRGAPVGESRGAEARANADEQAETRRHAEEEGRARRRAGREAEEPDAAAHTGKRKVKVSFLDFGERLRGMLRRSKGPGGRAEDARNPVVTLVLAFVLWAVIRIIGYGPLMLLLKFIGFLFTPLGLPVWLFLAWYYSQNHRGIHRALDTLKRRAQMFASVASKAAGSVALLRGGVSSLFGRGGTESSERPTGKPVQGATVRMLEEDWDEPEED